MTASAASTREVDSLLEAAEEAFEAGQVPAARQLLEQAAALAGPERRAQVRNDLAVLAAFDGRDGEADTLLCSVLADDPGYVPALENLASVCEGAADLVQATHWRRRTTELAPTEPDVWRRLASTLSARRHFGEAHEALVRAAGLGHDVVDDLADVTARLARTAGDGGGSPPVVPAGRVLIAVDYFHPSVGGSERLAEMAGTALQTHGMTVEIATRALEGRTSLEHRGMRIHEISGDPLAGLRALVNAGRYDGLLVFSAPTAWPLVSSLRLPKPGPKLVVVPCINAENSGQLREDPALLRSYEQLLGAADVIGFSSRAGHDVRLLEGLGLPGVYVPNAVERTAAAGEFRSAHGIPSDRPMLLFVANMWPEKNHLGLLGTLRDHPGDWTLALIGAPSPRMPDIAAQVEQLADEDDRVFPCGPLGAGSVAAAMDEASAVLLPSLAEATPLVLLEAMSRRRPWIATPTCGSAHDHAGGLVLPLDLFGQAIDFLLADPAAAETLGAAGYEHWGRCYTWDVLGPRYAQLLSGESVGPLEAPVEAQRATESVRAAFYDRRVTVGAGRVGARP